MNAGALAAGIGLAFVPVFAYDITESSNGAVEQVVVSANRVETPVSQVGSAVSVITAEEIEKSGATTALDALKDIPGTSISANGGIGTTTYLYMRGMGYKNILVLVDGIDIRDTSTSNGSPDMTNLLASDIERIEVLRGNQSTLYGSRAMGGVISITTKSGRTATKPLAGGVNVEAGSYRTLNTNANAYGRSGNVYYSGSVAGFSTGGFDISKIDAGRENDGYNNKSANLRIGADVARNVGALDLLNVEGMVRSLQDHLQYDASGPRDANQLQRSTQDNGKFAVNADMFDGLLSNTFDATFSSTERDMYADEKRLSSNSFYDGTIAKYEYQGTLHPLEDHVAVFGVDRTREHIRTDGQATAVTNDGYYANYQIGFLDKRLTLTAGVRTDDHQTFGDHTTYRGTAAYHIPSTDTRFHTSYGTGFRAPSLYELYAPTTVYDMGWGPIAYVIGNANLKPEESRGYDFGVEQSFLGGRINGDVTFFNNRMSNEIAYLDSSVGYVNLSSSRAFGVESSLAARITDEVKLTGNYTYTQPRDNSTGNVSAGQPHHEGTLRVAYAPAEVQGLEVWGRGRFSTWRYDSYRTGSPYVGGWAVWDVGASYRLTDWASVYGRVENLFDKDYYTKGYYATPGLSGYAGVRMTF